MKFFMLFMSFVILQRLFELYIAKRNEKWMLEKGAVEIGQAHYKWFILLHILFFVTLTVEVVLQSLQHEIKVSWIFVWLFIILQIARGWCIGSLGKFWNTKIIVLHNVILIKKGPYRWLRHPNYIIVLIELFTIPFIFQAYFSSIIFPSLHILLLMIRIPAEEEALGKNIY